MQFDLRARPHAPVPVRTRLCARGFFAASYRNVSWSGRWRRCGHLLRAHTAGICAAPSEDCVITIVVIGAQYDSGSLNIRATSTDARAATAVRIECRTTPLHFEMAPFIGDPHQDIFSHTFSDNISLCYFSLSTMSVNTNERYKMDATRT